MTWSKNKTPYSSNPIRLVLVDLTRLLPSQFTDMNKNDNIDKKLSNVKECNHLWKKDLC
ncbi:hypothetical protein NSIN_30305 [Nitrosotalea sinensis]|uniref:Uncharacterized protein n=1 Tax=Nitrosotalea sinensis TaxID=1499975 RepID=A0A2H1EI04_9ARCH|nr:hypothetical protein NSIN_30305 [Candidatus Nitrosotalea sinensis]